MTDEEYIVAIDKIVLGGRGHRAIMDITKALEIERDNLWICIKDYEAEKQNIKKALEREKTNIGKIHLIESAFK